LRLMRTDEAGQTSRDVVNIKLDRTGGLTEALRTLDRACCAELDVMVGCMLGTSLAMAPAMILAQSSRFVDLDAPLLIGTDRTPAIVYRDGIVFPPSPEVCLAIQTNSRQSADCP
jgi:L-alanine-DL-glutamate epimerase-like enolase superfamily enzyme